MNPKYHILGLLMPQLSCSGEFTYTQEGLVYEPAPSFWPPRWLSGKESACQCRRHRRCGFNPWVTKILWRRKWHRTPVFLPGKFHGQRSLEGCIPGVTESAWANGHPDFAWLEKQASARATNVCLHTVVTDLELEKLEPNALEYFQISLQKYPYTSLQTISGLVHQSQKTHSPCFEDMLTISYFFFGL